MTDKKITLTKREAVFIPIKAIGPQLTKRIQEKYQFKFYDEKACKACEWRSERHCDMCDNCPAFVAGYELATPMKMGENRYLKVPVGSYKAVVDILEDRGFDVRIRDKSPEHKIQPIKFLGTFREGQEAAIEAMLEKKRGVIKAPPRSGKTVSSTAAICKIGQKTLIIASQRDWLMGFMETFIGSKTQKALTDIDPKRIKLCKTFKDFQTHDVCLATVQTFYSDSGQKLLRQLRDMFGTIVGDEIHYGAADKYIQILAKFNPRFMIGLSATPSRKDAKYILVRHVVGPIIHEVVVERMRPQIKLTPTKYTKAYRGRPRWDQMVSSLENDKKRQLLIAQQALKDIEAGHMIFIPMSRVKAIQTLIKTINDLAGKQVAYPFTGDLKKTVRDETLQQARQFKVKILVGTMKILSTGINVPRASCLYEVSMSSNKENAEQRMARVLTPMEGKPQPIIRFFLDNLTVRKSCMRNEWMNVLVPKFNPIVSERDKALVNAYFRQKVQQEKFDL